MRNVLVFSVFFLIIGCAPKNFYYKGHYSDYASNIFFDAKQEHPYYKLIGDNAISNSIFRYSIPDSLEGIFLPGECVVELKIDEKKNVVKDVIFVSLRLFDKSSNKGQGFDRYHPTLKRVDQKPHREYAKYLELVKTIVSSFKVEKLNSGDKMPGVAYCKIVFEKALH